MNNVKDGATRKWVELLEHTDGQPGISTLKRGAEASEGRILLRQCEDKDAKPPRRQSLFVSRERQPSQRCISNEGQSIDTPAQYGGASDTTSDLNSDDDAASIVSRLSKIVVEQEGRMTDLSGPTMTRPANNESRGTFNSDLKQVKSSGNIESLDEHNDHKWKSCDDVIGRDRADLTGPVRFAPSSQEAIPEIHVIDDRTPVEQVSVPERQISEPPIMVDESTKVRSKSVVVNFGDSNRGVEAAHSIRRNESSGHLPERGNLRELESSRGQTATDTMGGPDKQLIYDSEGRPMLNIRRSAWTLSQFDETFNKNNGDDGDSNTNTSIGELERSSLPLSNESLDLRTPSPERQASSGNLLMRASKNALKLTQNNGNSHSLPDRMTDRRHSAELPNLRRLSHCHSIVSLSSSSSSRAGLGKIGVGYKERRHTKSGGQPETSNDGCCKLSSFARYLPIIEWLPRYNRSLLWGDLTAGLVVGVMNITSCLSSAVVAETELGPAFRCSIINTFVFAVLCSSRHSSFGSWSIMSQLLVVSVRQALSDELILNRINLGPSTNWDPVDYERWHLNIIIMYAFLIGLVQLVCGLLNLGNILASFIPDALCSSMIAATAFVMAVGQLANMCGTSNKILWSIEKNTTELWADLDNPPLDITDVFADLFRWVKQIALLIKHHDQINVVCVALSVGSLALLLVNQYLIQEQLKRLFKRSICLPFEIVLPVIAISISYTLNLRDEYKVRTCGPIHIDFVIPSPPDLRLFRELWFDSVATALVSFTMVYIMAKTNSNKFNYEIDANQELIACGAGNLIGGMFDALPATASFNRTRGQVDAGGKTQMASIINCAVLTVLAQLFGHHAAALPVCVMSAALFCGFVRMTCRATDALHYWRICKIDFAIWIVTFVAILTTDIVNGFVCGLMFSILTMLYRAQNRRCYLLGTIGTSDVYVPLAKYPSAQEIDGIKIFQFCGPVYYVCADLFERLLRQKTQVDVKRILLDLDGTQTSEFNPSKMNLPTHIILDFSMISFVDSAAIHTIKKIIEDHKRVNVTIFIASLASHVAAVVKSEPALWGVYKERFYVTLADAVHCAMRDRRNMEVGTIQHVKV